MALATLDLVTDQRIAVLTATGDLDLGALEQLTATLPLLELADVDAVHLDAGGVTFVACCCLRPLDDSRRRMRDLGRSFQVVAASPIFRKVARWAQYPELASEAPEPEPGEHRAAR
jgi:anti-anti-sigma factor